eukprot:14874785-Alexandrium_andersonii.AAC.1
MAAVKRMGAALATTVAAATLSTTAGAEIKFEAAEQGYWITDYSKPKRGAWLSEEMQLYMFALIILLAAYGTLSLAVK